MGGVRANANCSANRPGVVKAAAPSVSVLRKVRRLGLGMGMLIGMAPSVKRVIIVRIFRKSTNRHNGSQQRAATAPGEKRQRIGGGTRSSSLP
jgi:hypothetical protein